MSTFSPNKNIELPAHNSFVDTWDSPVNADLTLIDTALGGSVSLNSTGLSGNQTLAVNQYQPLTLLISGTPSAAITYVVPAGVGGQWVFVNSTAGGLNVGIKSAAGGATIVIPAASNALVSCDGSATGMRLSVNVAPAAAGSTTQVQYNNGGLLAGSANLTFDGTTLGATGLNVAGNTVLGSGAGSTLTLNGTAVSVPNGLNIASNNLYLNGTQVGIGTATLAAGNLLTVAGNIKITSGGLIFSDATQLLSASALGAAGVAGDVQYNNGSSGFAADPLYNYVPGTHTLSVPVLTLTTPLAVTSGGTGAATSAGAIANLGIVNQSIVVPTTRVFTAAGAATYTPTSAAVKWIKVFMVGGGGGGGGSGGTLAPTGATGGDSIFNGVHAAGGLGGVGNPAGTGPGGAGGAAGSGTASVRSPGNAGGSGLLAAGNGVYGGIGAPGFFGGGPLQAATGSTAGANTGAGGGGCVTAGVTFPSGGGGGGEYVELNLPAAVYSYTVGAAGAGGIGTAPSGLTGGAGSVGLIIVEEHCNF